MDISVFAFIILATVLLLTVVAVGYFLLYMSNINRALVTKGRKHLHMMPPYRVVMVLAVILILFIAVPGVIYLSGIGRSTTAHDVEEKMRRSQAVNDEWNVEVAMSDNYAAAIAYDGEQTDHTFAVYRNDNNIFTDFAFRYGGHTTSVERSVSVYKFDGTLALISMNALHIAKIACHDGDIYALDPNRPFVLILPSGGFDVYDDAGNLIDLEQDWWYEIREVGEP